MTMACHSIDAVFPSIVATFIPQRAKHSSNEQPQQWWTFIQYIYPVVADETAMMMQDEDEDATHQKTVTSSGA